jgi:hypothetical protein
MPDEPEETKPQQDQPEPAPKPQKKAPPKCRCCQPKLENPQKPQVNDAG